MPLYWLEYYCKKCNSKIPEPTKKWRIRFCRCKKSKINYGLKDSIFVKASKFVGRRVSGVTYFPKKIKGGNSNGISSQKTERTNEKSA